MITMLKSLIHPTYSRAASKHILFAAILYFVISPIFAVATFALFDTLGFERNLPELRDRAAFSLIYSAIIEELAFRLPIKYSKTAILLSSFAFAIICTPYLMPTRVFLFDIFLIIGLSLIFIFIESFIHNYFSLSFTFYFYTVLFSVLHLLNISYTSLTYCVILFEILYCISKMFDGMILGYIRLKSNIIISILLHIAFNISAVLGPKIIAWIINTTI